MTTELITVFSSEKKYPDKHGPTRTHIRAALPMQLTPTYWLRHQLTGKDIDTIMCAMPSTSVTITGLCYGVDVPMSALKPAYSSPYAVSISSKTVVTRRVKQAIAKIRDEMVSRNPRLQRQRQQLIDVLDTVSIASSDHSPPLPRHVCSQDVFERASSLLLSRITPFDESPTQCVGLFSLLGCLWVTIQFEGDAIVAGRAVLETEYISSGRAELIDNMSIAPTTLRIKCNKDEKNYIVLLDECMLICASQ